LQFVKLIAQLQKDDIQWWWWRIKVL